MSRMLEALRRLEAAELFAPPARGPADLLKDGSQADLEIAAEDADGESPWATEVAHAQPATVATTSAIALDAIPFEPAFGPLAPWDEPADFYTPPALEFDDYLPASDDVAASDEPPIAAETETPPAPAAEAGAEPLKTLELCQECLEELIETPVATFAPPEGEPETKLEASAFQWQDLFPDAGPRAANGEADVDPAAQENDEPPADTGTPGDVPHEVPREGIAAQQNDAPPPSAAERAGLADLSDPCLARQFAELGQQMLSDLGKTTRRSAVLMGAEHQPHVTDVTLRTALALAQAGRQVLVVDAAGADKHLTSGLELSAEFGLSEALKGRVPWQQAVRATATGGLCILPAGRLAPPRLSERDRRLETLLAELSGQWDLVLLDGGCVHDDPAAAIAQAARNVYLLVRLGETRADAAAEAVAAIEDSGANLRGCVATNA